MSKDKEPKLRQQLSDELSYRRFLLAYLVAAGALCVALTQKSKVDSLNVLVQNLIQKEALRARKDHEDWLKSIDSDAPKTKEAPFVSVRDDQ